MTAMKPQILSASAFLACASLVHAQDAKPLSLSQVPLRADAPVLFAPRGWKIEKTVNADLNSDKVADAALVLVQNTPAKDAQGDPTPRQRALLMLLREGKGWHRVGFNGEILLGTRDGGAFFGVVETPVTISIEKGVVIVEQESGSREVTSTTHRFQYNRFRKGVFFIGFDSVERDRGSGDVTSQSLNFLRGLKKTTTYDYATKKSKTTNSRISGRLRTLESLREADRYEQ